VLAVYLCLLVMACLSIGNAHSAGSALAADSSAEAVTVQYCASGTDRLTLDQATQCHYASYADAAPAIQGNAVRWARVQATTSEPYQTLTINVGPHLVREVELFDGKTGRRLGGPVGLAYPYSPEHGLLVGYTFSVTPNTVGEHTYYVRIVTVSFPYAFVEATLDPVKAQTMSQQIGLGIHLGVLSLLVLISASVYAVTRAPVMGVFALVILNLLLNTLGGSGILFQYLWPDWPRFNEFFFSTMAYLRPGLWVWLAQTFLASYQTPRWYRPSCQIAYGIVAVMIVASWFGFNVLSNVLVLVFAMLIFPIGQIMAIWMTQNIRRAFQRILISGYVIGTIGIWAGLLVVLFPTDNQQLPIQISRVIDYANPVVLLGLVMFHYRETILQLAATQQENVTIKLGLELEQKLREERKLMVDMLTHELKNPLASISLASGSLATAVKDNDRLTKRRLANIEQSVRSMDAVIERCNVMNQLDQSALVPNLSRISLQDTLSNIISRFSDGQRVKVTIESPNEFVTDPQFFEMMVANLIDNALKYSHTDSDVTVSIMRQHQDAGNGSELVMTVTNQVGSKGVPDKNLVFTRFYRHQLAHRTSGSGVGLYLTRALVTLMSGRIDYLHDHHSDHQSENGHVTFRVTLPEAKSNA